MKYYIIVFLFSTLFSCDLSNSKELSVSKLVSDELETFNWKDVDTFPRFQNCDTIINRESNFNCFVNTLTTKIQANLINNDIVVYESIADTIMIVLLQSIVLIISATFLILVEFLIEAPPNFKICIVYL